MTKHLNNIDSACLQIKKIGNSTGLILPKEALAQLGWAAGDKVYMSYLPEGGVKLSPRDPDFVRGMEIARNVIKKYSRALQELAK